MLDEGDPVADSLDLGELVRVQDDRGAARFGFQDPVANDRDAERIGLAYMPYKYVLNRVSLDMTQRRVIGYRRTPFWQDWWQYVDIDDTLVGPDGVISPANAAITVTTGGAVAISADAADSARKADPALMEPMMAVEVETPEQFVGVDIGAR